MKLCGLCILVATVTMFTSGELLPPKASYKVLMLLPVSTRSQLHLFMALAEGLADRGHKIVMLTNHPATSKHPNITEYYHGLPYYKEQNVNMFDVRQSGGMKSTLEDVVINFAQDLYELEMVQKLYNGRNEFDIIITTASQNVMVYPFLPGIPFIIVVPHGHVHGSSGVIGNVPNIYVPNVFWHIPSNATLMERTTNFIKLIQHSSWIYWDMYPKVHNKLQRNFPDLPPLIELEKNQSVSFVNTHFSVDLSIPLLPSQVEIACIHCRPSKPLPQDLESWVTGAGSSGVIYFSLGSLARGDSMPMEYVNFFLEAFRRLPQRVLWKYEGKLKGVSDNVMISPWLPQQDVLSHKNVMLFMSHCGLLSTHESIYHSTPILCLPLFSDQIRNAMFVKSSCLGDILEWEKLTVTIIVDSINQIINNPKYKNNVKNMSSEFQDQLTTPKERAIFWTEYVIQHGGAPNLKCPGMHLSWLQYLILDVVAFIFIVTLIILYIVYRVTLLIWKWSCSFTLHNKQKME